MKNYLLYPLLILSFACTPYDQAEKDTDLTTSHKETTEALDTYLDNISKLGFIESKDFNRLLVAFDSEEDKTKKLQICGRLMLAEVNMQMNQKKMSDYLDTDEKESTYQKARGFCQSSMEELFAFDSSLAPEDFKKIARGADRPLIVYTQKLFDLRKNDCDLNQLEKVIARNPKLEKYVDMIPQVIGLAISYEDKNFEVYAKNYIELIEEKQPPNAEWLKQMALYFSAINIKNGQTEAAIKSRESRIKWSEEKLAKSHVGNPRDFTEEMVQLSPRCLGQVSIGTIDFSKQYTTKRDLKWLSEDIKKFRENNKKWPERSQRESLVAPGSSWRELEEGGKFLFKKRVGVDKDAYGRDYHFQIDGEKFKAASFGKDRRPDTPDDIVVEISL